MTSSSNIEAAAARWIAREDSESWSADRSQELQRWLDADTAHRVAWLRLRAAWSRADRLGALRPPSAGLDRQAASKARRLISPRVGLPIAASLAALTVAAAVGLTIIPNVGQKTYATQLGGRETIDLSDGSHLTLNTNTRLRAQVTAKARIVRLDQGEAFFDVKHDAAHPFVVIAGNRRITDLGTKFSVRRDGDVVKVVVEEGRVSIEPINASLVASAAPSGAPAAPDAPAIVTRDQVAAADSHAVLVVAQSDSQLARDLSWRQGLLSFNQTTLAEAAGEFNRYNDKKLVIDDAAAGAIRIDGAFRANNAASFARLLRDGFGLKVEDEGDAIHVSS